MPNKVPVANRFVRAKYDTYGNRQGPVLGFVIHMAEGNNVWSYLAFGNVARGVSVHFTIEADGEIVQMLELHRISGSINPGTIRRDDDTNGHFGASHARYVLGEWWLNPNHTVITVEVAGRALEGPNEKQVASIDKLFTFLRGKYPRIKPLGHRDFQNVKPCPGQKMWREGYPPIGGHGKDFKPANMSEGGGSGDTETGDEMILAGEEVDRNSSHYIQVPSGTEVYDAPGGEKVRTIRETKQFNYFGWVPGGYRALGLQVSGDNFADGEPKGVIAYIKKADNQVIGQWPDPVGPEPEPPQPSPREEELVSALQEVKDSVAAITAESSDIASIVDEALA